MPSSTAAAIWKCPAGLPMPRAITTAPCLRIRITRRCRPQKARARMNPTWNPYPTSILQTKIFRPRRKTHPHNAREACAPSPPRAGGGPRHAAMMAAPPLPAGKPAPLHGPCPQAWSGLWATNRFPNHGPAPLASGDPG